MIWLLGCAGKDDPPPPNPPTADTGSALTPGCHLDPDNVLRFRCAFDRDGTGPIAVQVTSEDGTAAFPGDPTALTGRIAVWDLLAETPYTWSMVDRGAAGLSGSLTTTTLPDADRLTVTPLIDGPTAVQRQVFTMSCGRGPTVYALDGEGRLRWYQEVDPGLFVAGFDATDRGSVLVNIGRTTVQEWGFDGTLRADLVYPDQLPRVVHHAVLGRGGATVVLDTQPVPYPDGDVYLVDGITAIDGDAATHLWDVGEVLDPQGLGEEDALYWEGYYPGAVDFGHENAIDALPDGGWLVSFKHLDTVVRLNADLSLRWWLPGHHPVALFAGPMLDLGGAPAQPSTFGHQHHVTMEADGNLLLFDNERDDLPSKVLEIAIDEAALTATVVGSWGLGVSCPVQSSAFRLADGSVLAACAATREVYELDATGIRRQVSLACGDGGLGTSFVRSQPLPSLTSWDR